MPADLKNTQTVGFEEKMEQSTLNCLSIAMLGEETPIREIAHVRSGVVATTFCFDAMMAIENASNNS